MNSKQRRSKRRVVSRIESRILSNFSQELSALDKVAKKVEAENRELRRVRTELSRDMCPIPSFFHICDQGIPTEIATKRKAVRVEMVRYSVSIPFHHFKDCDERMIDLYREEAAYAIYKEFKKRAIVEAEKYRDEGKMIYTLSVALPVQE